MNSFMRERETTRPYNLNKRRRLTMLALLVPALSFASQGRDEGSDQVVDHKEIPLLIWQLTDQMNQPLPAKPVIQRIVDYLSQKSGIHFRLQGYPWNRALKLANEGVAPIWGLSVTPERAQHFVYSHAIYESNVWMLVKKSFATPIPNLAALAGKRVSIFRGVSYGAEFDAAKNHLFQVEEDSDNLRARVAKLLAGRCDVMLYANHHRNVEQVILELKESGFDPQQLKVLDNPLLSEPAYIAISKEKIATFPMEELNRVIDTGRRNGEIMRLLRD